MQTSLTVGRTDQSDLVIPSPFLSSQHAKIELIDIDTLTFVIEDLGSTNGTTVNGERVEESEFVIGDRIQLGEYELKPSEFIFYFLEGGVPGQQGGGSTGTAVLLSAIFMVVGGALGAWVATSFFGLGNFSDVALRTVAFVLLLQLFVYLGVLSYRTIQNLKFDKSFYRQQHEGFVEKLSIDLQAQLDAKKVDDHRWTGFRRFEVARKVEECRGISSFYLKPHDGKEIPAYYPGQYLTFRLQIPGQTRDVIRCYSLSDCYREDHYRISIKRAEPPPDAADAPPGLASSFFHDSVNEGDIVDVKPPTGNFYLNVRQSEGVVLLAGGIGVTPMLSMLSALVETNSRQPVWFFYGVKNSFELVQVEHLRSIAESHNNVELVLCFSKPQDYEELGEDYHHAGRVTTDLLKEKLGTNNYQFYLCGSGPFMDSLTTGLNEWGVPDNKVHTEAFGPSSVSKKPAPGEAQADTGEQFEIDFAKSQNKVKSSNLRTILEIAEENSVPLDFGCRVGNCGTCSIAIRSGNVKYEGDHDADIEEGSCLACIAKPASNLVLDI